MNKKRLIGLCIFGFLVFTVYTFQLAVNGKISITYYAVIITLVVFIAELFMKLASCRGEIKGKTRKIIFSVFFSIILCEIILRSLGVLDSYNERKGGFYYLSAYHVPSGGGGNKSWLHLRTDRNERTYEKYLEYDYIIETNSEGLRDIDHSIEKAPNELRIVGLGDSFTEGVGSTLNEHSWTKMLEKSLTINDSTTTTVFNGGVSGSDPYFEYMLLKDIFLKYDPDYVIVAINLSDIDDIMIRGGMERFQPDTTVKYKTAPWFEPLFGMSRFFRFFMLDVFDYSWHILSPEGREAEVQKARDLIYACVMDFEKLAQKENFELLVVFHPVPSEVLEHQWEFTDLIERLEDEGNINVVDLKDYYINVGKLNDTNIDTYYWPIDLHHNEMGYALFARGVKKKLEELLHESDSGDDQ